MACRVQRVNGHINKVFMENGEESKTYWDLVKAAEEMPDEVYSNVRASLKPFIGKQINDTDNPQEVALGLYMQLHTDAFKSWFGDWEHDPESVINRVNKRGEPLMTDHKDTASFEGLTKGDYKSVFNNGPYAQTEPQIFKSYQTKQTEDLFDTVKRTSDVLRERYDAAKTNIKKIDNDPTLSHVEKVQRKAPYETMQKQLVEQNKALIKANTFDAVRIQAENDLAMAQKMIDGDKVSIADLRFGSRVAQYWADMHDWAGTHESTKATQDIVQAYVGKANDLQYQFGNIAKRILADYSKAALGAEGELTPEELRATQEISGFHAQVRTIATTKSKIANYFAKLVQNTNLAINRDRNANNQRIQEAWLKVKDHAEIKKNGFKSFFNEEKDAIGKDTLSLRTNFSRKYSNLLIEKNAKLQDALDKAGTNKAAHAAAYAEYNDFIKKNAVPFDLVPFVERDVKGNLTHSDKEMGDAAEKMRSQGFGTEEIQHMIKETADRYFNYKQDGEDYRHGITADVEFDSSLIPSGVSKEDFIDQKSKEWMDLHDPIAHQKFINGDIGLNTAPKGFEYGVHYPAKEINGKDSEYYDPEFTKISNDPKLNEFYTFFKGFIAEHLNHMPAEDVARVGDHFLPVISTKLATEFGLSGDKNILSGMNDWMMKALTQTDYNRSKKIDPVTGKVMKEIKTRFMNDHVPVEGRSRDMVTMMKMFSDMATVYRHKIASQDMVETLNDYTQKMTSHVDGDGEVVPGGSDNLQKLMESTLNHSFYGDGRENEGVVKSRSFYNAADILGWPFGYKSPEYKEAKRLEIKINEVNHSLDTEALTDEQREEKEAELINYKDAHEKLGGRQFAWSKAADALIKGSRYTTMAANPFSAARSFIFGMAQNATHAYGGIDFTTADLTKATYALRESTAKYITWGTVKSETAEKMLRLTLDANVIEQRDNMFSQGSFHKDSPLDVIKKAVPSPFTLIQSGHYFFKAQLGMAMMEAAKIHTSMGDVRLIDGMNKDMTWNEEKYGKFDAAANGGKDFDQTYQDFTQKYNQVANTLHGNYGDALHVRAKDTIFGRALIMFKTFLPEAMAHRFEGSRMDPLLMRRTEGFYRTFAKDISDSKFQAVKHMWDAVVKGSVEGFDATTVHNLRKMFAEGTGILGLMIGYMALKALAPSNDDDKDKKAHYNLVLNQLFLVKKNMEMYIDPASFADMTKNVFPVLQTITNYGNAMEAVGYHLMGSENQKGQPMYDGPKMWKTVTKALPVLNNYNRVVNYERSTMQTGS